MSYLDKINYQIYKIVGFDFEEMLGEFLLRIDTVVKVLRIVCFFDIDDNEVYLSKLEILRRNISKVFGSESPAVTLVAQKPLDAGLVVEVHSYLVDDDDIIEYKVYSKFPYVVINNRYGKFLYAGGLQTSLHEGIYSQGKHVFDTLDKILKKEGFTTDSIVRQWNYIEKITAFDNKGNQHYQMFNNSRTEYYSPVAWNNGYPSATGIGTLAGGVIIDIDAAVIDESSFSVIPIDNRLQVAAHAYSETVLENAETGLTTPKFERAKRLDDGIKSLVYVSGTAAIRGEDSICDDVEEQLEVTLENIGELIVKASIKMLRVYLKHSEDFIRVYAKIPNYDGASISYLLADVCRDELLIEIEGIAFD